VFLTVIALTMAKLDISFPIDGFLNHVPKNLSNSVQRSATEQRSQVRDTKY